ncbi:MAG: hypothetical protein HY289_12315 [Planctomycetes bacterium]|nr:hypothetical protein [Planctomycetota bacterium]
MVAHGHVQNGVVVLDDGVRLPEGQKVTVVPALEQQSGPYPVSKEQREATLRLIGIWKTDNPPSDEAVEKIIDEYRTKKYG